MVQTSRNKDKAKLEEITETGLKFNQSKFDQILKAHRLMPQWKQIKKAEAGFVSSFF